MAEGPDATSPPAPTWRQVPEPTQRPGRTLAGERPGATPGQVRRAHLARTAWRAVVWFGRTVAALVSFVLFGLIGLVAIVVPWAFQRVLWLDPLGVRRPRGSRWVPRRHEPANAAHPWVRDPAQRRPHPLLRVRTFVAVAAVLFAALVVTVRATHPLNMDSIKGSRVYAGVPWWPAYVDDLSYIGEPGTVWNSYDWQKVHDVRTRYINVRNQERVTWRPPPCDCPTVTLWMYGGSTTFGFGQRDEHTIASELARIAHREGIRLEVHNRGVPGDTHWQESQRFTWDISKGDPPDVVAFYDGVNDIAAAGLRNAEHRNWDDQPISLSLEAARNSFGRSWRDRLFMRRVSPKDAHPLPDPTAPDLTDAQWAARAVSDYDRSRLPTIATAERLSVPALFFWQPMRASRPPVPEEDPGDGDGQARALASGARKLLPKDVIDLSDSVAGTDAPIFYDYTHHNELGARLIAEAMYDHLRPAIDAAAAKAGNP